ncbi:hypothetical protein HRbin16_02919 [bacterium HR16]|nr:hypothetical protein HRbin16_02919 [bacterium HR16]
MFELEGRAPSRPQRSGCDRAHLSKQTATTALLDGRAPSRPKGMTARTEPRPPRGGARSREYAQHSEGTQCISRWFDPNHRAKSFTHESMASTGQNRLCRILLAPPRQPARIEAGGSERPPARRYRYRRHAGRHARNERTARLVALVHRRLVPAQRLLSPDNLPLFTGRLHPAR